MKTILELEDLASQAIKAALAQQWQEAEQFNLEILAEDDQNIEATNRLARAYQELGQTPLAKKTYQQVLTLDPYNVIAQKNLDKLAQGVAITSGPMDQGVFLEEPGKTRAASLQQPVLKKLAQLSSGEALGLEARHNRLAVTSPKGDLVGYVDDELASHLLNLMHLGNTYSVYLMANSDKPQIFLREVSQSPQAAKFISFTRVHASPLALTTVKDGLNQEAKFNPEHPGMEEDTDNWDADAQEDSADTEAADDDFASVSLEAMREEEDTDYGHGSSMRDEY